MTDEIFLTLSIYASAAVIFYLMNSTRRFVKGAAFGGLLAAPIIAFVHWGDRTALAVCLIALLVCVGLALAGIAATGRWAR
jgi:hypothetical protein